MEDYEETTTTTTTTTTIVLPDDDAISDDDDFCQWILQELTTLAPQVQELYPRLFEKCAEAVMKWRRRYHGNMPLWKRLFKPERLLKEVVESVPVVDAVEKWMEQHHHETTNDATSEAKNENSTTRKITIVDLCSGKGYLSMLLSEILPPDRVEKCLLIDKAWPLCHSTPLPHHMSWEHIYGDVENEDGPKYFDTWPIPLVTSKQNLKQSREIRQLQDRFSKEDGPVLILAVHLCGTLSIQAVKLFQAIPTAEVLLLKPCCLPDIWHAKNADTFQIGHYCFPTKDVCARGKWTTNKKSKKGSRWNGPPRFHLEAKFDKWCTYLHEAMGQDGQSEPEAQDAAATVGTKDAAEPLEETTTGAASLSSDSITHDIRPIATKRFEVPLQTKGGFQNSFLYAERA